MKPVTTDDILDAIREAMNAPRDVESEPGVTTSEIAAAIPNCSIHRARHIVQDLLAEGTMVCTRVRRRTMGGFGGPCEVQGYRLKA